MTLERFADRAKRVLVLAQDEALQMGHHYIGTEHLLLGLLSFEDAHGGGPLHDQGLRRERVRAEVLARLRDQISEAVALRSIGVDPDAIFVQARERLGVELQVQGQTVPPRRLPDAVDPAEAPAGPPFTPRVFKVLNLAVGIAAGGLVGPQHLLQAILEEDGGLAVVVLDRLAVDLEALHVAASS